jgi:tetratricopeptide (TPR) repeat protein
MTFEEALKLGDLDTARVELDELAKLPETGGLYMPECYADLAQSFDRQGRHDDAIAAMQRAIEHGWSGRPDGRSDIAEFHLRAGRAQEAARIWAQLKASDPDDVWLYNAAGLTYAEIGEHELAVAWLGDGIKLAIDDDDPEGIVAQLSDLRRRSLQALGREPDDVDRSAAAFLENWQNRKRRSSTSFGAVADVLTAQDAPISRRSNRGGEIAVAFAWFPAGEYERAIERWPSLAEDWAGVPHAEYCARMDGHVKFMRAHGIAVRAISPIVVDEFIAWCDEHTEDPEHARAPYAAHQLAHGQAIPWPPGRNAPCWCGSQRKYKKCCGPARAAQMHASR